MVKQHWSNESSLPPDLTQSQADYLQELQANLNIARKLADETSTRMQDKYVHYYNLRSRDKSFDVGQQVLILIPDSTNKTFSQWQGPATVIEKKAPYSYIIELNGARRHLHADKLRPYHVRIESVTCAATNLVCVECTDATCKDVLNSSFSDDYQTNGNGSDNRATTYFPEQTFSVCGCAAYFRKRSRFWSASRC